MTDKSQKLIVDNKGLDFKLTENGEKTKLRLSKLNRLAIFVVFFALHFFNCSDGGVPSAASNNIKKDLNFDDKEFGKYGSIVQIGRIIGTFIVMALLNMFNRKYLIIIALFFKCSSFLIYFVTYNYWIIIIFRFIQGVSHVFTYVYFPAWIHQYGMQTTKALMLTFIQTASPYGSVFGFSVTSFIGTEHWRYGFGILAFCIIPLNIILFFIPDTFFSDKVFFFRTIEEKMNVKITMYSKDKLGHEQPDEEREEDREYVKSVYSLFEVGESQALAGKKTDSNIYYELIFNPAFSCVVLARTVIMFIFMAIHYWLGDYFVNVLEITNKLAKSSSYSFISLVGPLVGGSIGTTWITYIGGYQRPQSGFIAFFFAVLTGISAMFVPAANNLMHFSIALFAYFALANCLMPILIGISFNAVPDNLAASSYGVNSLLCTFLGNLPAPSVYGYINQYFKATNKKMAMLICMSYIWVAVILVGISAIFYYRKQSAKINKAKNVKEDEELKDIENK